MKKFAAILLMMCPLIMLQAQREYLPTPDDLDHFYSTKTYVVLNDNPISDYNLEIRDAVQKYWTITEYEFLDFDRFEEMSADGNASFLYIAAVNFEKDRSNTRYKFLCLSLGGDYISLNDMKDITNLPVSYYGVDEDHFAYKLGTIVRFMQDHIRLLTEHPELVSQNVFNHYNENMADISGKTLYLVEDELAPDVSSEAKIRAYYPNEVKIVDREEIKELIMNGDKDAVFLHKVGPEGKKMDARVYKILIGVAEGKFYYFDYHKVSNRNPDAFLASDFKKLGRAAQ